MEISSTTSGICSWFVMGKFVYPIGSLWLTVDLSKFDVLLGSSIVY
jgi:hypothetical protein